MALGLLKSNADIKCWSNMGETNINWCSGCQVLNLLKTNLIRLKQFLLITLLGHSGCRKWSSLSANRKLIDLRQLNWKLSWQVLFFRPETKSNQNQKRFRPRKGGGPNPTARQQLRRLSAGLCTKFVSWPAVSA